MYNLKNKVAIVTGAAGRKGLGYGIAKRLAGEGADVAVVDKFPVVPEDADKAGRWQGLKTITREIETMGCRGLSLTCDISKSDEVDNMVRETVAKLGQVDILVNNAGIHIYAGISEITDEVWAKHLAVNLTGTFYCSRAAAREMLKRGKGGRIINIASLLGKAGQPGGNLAYCASKFGMIGLTQSLALELAPHRMKDAASAAIASWTIPGAFVRLPPALRALSMGRVAVQKMVNVSLSQRSGTAVGISSISGCKR